MKNIVIIFLFMVVSKCAIANNLNIANTSFNSSDNTVTFTISWDNSWRLSTGPSNWDAVWVFVKRQACSSTNIWASQKLSTTSVDHTNSGSLLTVDAVSDGMGVFIRRASTATATGSIPSTTITLKLNTTASGTSPVITTGANDNFKVMGMEMVYVPQGSFYLGDGRSTNSNNFSAGNNASSAFLIDASKQNAGLGVSTVYCNSFTYGCPSALPSTFPIGYNGFYCMKYELAVSAYVDFLNCLTYDQQAQKHAKWGAVYPNAVGSAITYQWNTSDIKVSVAGTYNTIPAKYSQHAISLYRPIAGINWQDLASYLDWAGIRPMTEFEFEKACRGNDAGTPKSPIANELPWGSTTSYQAREGSNHGAVNEAPNALGQQGLAMYDYADWWNWSPMRSGAPATANSTRIQAGATYYGIMEMGGNVWEQCVGGGSGYDYSTFTIVNGDGALTNLGLANVTGWPSNGGPNNGTILRGGSFNVSKDYMRISDRTLYAGDNLNISTENNMYNATGGRGVRTMSY
jgi:formylglycine-generating enzyme required for sulfatase activity